MLKSAALAIALLAAVPAVAQEHCTPVHFPPGQSTATIHGVAPVDDVACYTFGARPGQTATVRTDVRDMIISVIGVGDGRQEWTFKTTAHNKFVVGVLGRQGAPKSFTVQLSIR